MVQPSGSSWVTVMLSSAWVVLSRMPASCGHCPVSLTSSRRSSRVKYPGEVIFMIRSMALDLRAHDDRRVGHLGGDGQLPVGEHLARFRLIEDLPRGALGQREVPVRARRLGPQLLLH